MGWILRNAHRFNRALLLCLCLVIISCLPKTKKTSCDSDEAYDSKERKCVPTLASDGIFVTISNKSPDVSSSFASTDNNSYTYQVTINDPYGAGYSLQWYLIGNGASTLVGQNTTSYDLTPSSVGDGSFVLELVLKSDDGSETYSSTTWNITIGAEAVPYFDTSTNNYISTVRSNTAVLFQINVYDPSSFGNLKVKLFIDGVQSSGGTQTSSGSPYLFTETVDASTYSIGSHTVRAFVYNSSESTLYNSFTWVMDVTAPDFSDVVASDPLVSCGTTLVEGVALNNATSPAVNDCDNTTTTYCIDVDDQDDTSKHPSGVKVQFYWDAYLTASKIGSETTLTGDTICLVDVEPTFSKSLASGNTQETHAILTKFYDVSTGLEMYQSNDERVEWTVELIEVNRSPQITIASSNTHCTSATIDEDTTTSISTCAVTQNTAQAFEINILWDEYTDPEGGDIGNFTIDFYLDGTLLDGNHENSVTDCADEGTITCNLVLKPFDDSGPIDPSGLTYTLTAIVTDNGSTYGGGSKSSNTLIWTIDTITESYSDPTATVFTFDAATYTENDTATITITHDDTDGDDYKYTIYHINDDTGSTDACGDAAKKTAYTSNQLTRSDLASNNTSQTDVINWLIPQDLVTTAAEVAGDIYFCVHVESVTFGTLETEAQLLLTFPATNYIEVAQYNPLPVADTDEVPTRTDTQIVLTSMPFSFDAPTITDTSAADGDTLSYQWQINGGNVSAAGTWTDITGADSTSLVWSPGHGQNFDVTAGNAEAYTIRLCIGDDGYDNPVASCNTSVEWNDVTPISNVTDLTGADGTNTFGPDLSELATTYDSTNNVSYSVYVSDATLPNRYLIVEKVFYNSDGKIYYNEVIDSVSLQTDNLSTITTEASDLSIAVDEDSEYLFISYIADDDTLVTYPRPHIVRINLEDDNRVSGTLDHNGSFGFSYSGPSITSSDPADITINLNASDQTEIIINAVEIGDQVLFNHKNLVTAQLGTDFCTSCSSGSSVFNAAQELADYINNYNATTDLQGISATVSGNEVIITEVMSNDYIDFPVAANGMGRIMIDSATDTFYVPVVNNSLTGSDKNKISIFSGTYTSVGIDNITMTQVNLTADTDASSYVTSTYNDTENIIYFATKDASTGVIDMYAYDTGGATVEATNADIWSGTLVDKINIRYDDITGGDKIYLLGTTVSEGALSAYQVPYDNAGNSFTTGSEIESAVLYDDLTVGYQLNALEEDIHAFDFAVMETTNDLALVINSHESVSGLVDGTNVYILKLSMDSSSTMKADCSYDQDPDAMNCTPLNNKTTYDYVDNTEVSISKVHLNETIGSEGATSNENIKNIAIINYMVNDGANDVVQNVIINAEEDYFTPTDQNFDSYSPAFLPP
ncbi:hypothetical protein N9N67_07155 [Bacteriovoracaceae bacterium]|nr:hypothetical protein [Bacteriovoracaceae bacterium]